MQPWYRSALGWILLSCFLIALFAFSSLAKADLVEFPESELSRESVLPVFDQPEAVKKKYVPSEGRVEVGVFGGAMLNDAFLNAFEGGAEVQYHISDFHAVGVMASGFTSQATSYTGQINSSVQTGNGQNLINFSTNPAPSLAILGEYEFTPYYGKISLSKQTVLNIDISAELRGGMMTFNTGGSSATGGLGLNERFFFTRNFGLKVDLYALLYQKLDVLASTPTNTTATSLFVTLGLVYLLPSL